MKKKLLSVLLSTAMVASLLVACGSTTEEAAPAADDAAATTDDAAADDDAAPAVDTAEATDDVAVMEAPSVDGWDDSMAINVYLWDADGEGKVQEVIDNMPSEYADYINIVNLNQGGQSEEYINGLNSALDGSDAYADVMLFDEGIAKQWTETDQTAVLADLGLTSDMYANAYSYTVDYATYEGDLKAMTWQATPGAFIYRADIAEEVLGAKTPEEVQEYVKDWDTFMDTAATLKDAGYKMVAGTNEIKYPILNQRKGPWVEVASDGSETLKLDDTLKTYAEKAKVLYDNEYTNQADQWSGEWSGAMADGDVFGYFGCTWFLGTMESNCPEDAANFGNWATTVGPDTYYWGGTYLAIGADTKNPELAAYFVYEMCCDEDVMYNIAKNKGDFVNNKAAVDKLIADGVGERDILGGQNPFGTFADAARAINTQSTYVDGKILGWVDEASKAYNAGDYESADDVIQYIKDEAAKAYDYLTIE